MAAMTDHPDQITLSVRAGDAVVTDYRLLHGTHANATARRRDGILLNFAPSWSRLPPEIRGHLIKHPSLPTDAERMSGSGRLASLLPSFDGPRRDLPLERVPPSSFSVPGVVA